MIKLEKIVKNIRNKHILKDIDLFIPPGKVTALCGPNGAGKTTLVRILLKLVQADSGNVNYSMPMKSISFMLHNNSLFEDLTLIENINFFLGIKGIDMDPHCLDKYLNLLSLQDELRKKVSTFSKGMSQKADLLRALMEKPEVLLLDEPTSHLDPIGKIELRKLFRDLVEDDGLAILFTSHLLLEVEKIADDVVILVEGELKWRGELHSLLETGQDLETKFIEIISGNGENHSNEKL
ncbi:MAG: ABC transporter ATP-binding protein [Candidatus Aminicenantes bacterium]|nr:ABC transporter ATP-binding protein [Candidatus Aminicenantes bacterium]